MKIAIPSQVVNVDADKWATEFGVDKEDVREDVRAYFKDWFQQQVIQLGLDAPPPAPKKPRSVK